LVITSSDFRENKERYETFSSRGSSCSSPSPGLQGPGGHPRLRPTNSIFRSSGKSRSWSAARIKPLDTVARNSLLIIHGKQELLLKDSRHLTAIHWLADVLFNAPVADQYPVFLVQNADVLGLFGWEQRDRKDFSFAELSPFLKQIDEQGALAEKVESVQRSAYQSAIVNLRNSLSLYQRLKNSIQPEGEQNFAAELNVFERNLLAARGAASQIEAGSNFDQRKRNDIATIIQRYEKAATKAYILSVPSVTTRPSVNPRGEWRSMSDSLLQAAGTAELHPITRYLCPPRRRLSGGQSRSLQCASRPDDPLVLKGDARCRPANIVRTPFQ
jgi:hypothetical protein